MANNLSAKKRIRQTIKRRDRNRYYKKAARTGIRNLRAMESKKEAEEFFPKVVSMIDRLAKKNVWHKNKAANLKSKLQKHINGLSA